METRKKPNQDVYIPPARRNKTISGANGHSDDSLTILTKSVADPTCRSSNSLKDLDDVNANLASLSISQTNGASHQPHIILSDKSTIKSNTKSAPKSNTLSSDVPNNRNEPSINYDDFRHIIEIYDFAKELQTMHLQAELRGFEDGGFHIKWVDDTHALAVFSSISDANRALAQISGLFMKARPLKDASLPSKWKLATSPGDWAMPYKKRPPTTSSTARRLISNHLGLPAFKQKTAEQIQREREDKEALREAKARANAIKQAQQAMWDD